MNKETCKIHIIGAGLSGFVAAKVFEDNGYKPVILESTDSVGGRVKTDVVNSNPTIDAAFCNAYRVTFAGSTIPALNISSNCPVCAL